MLEYLFVCSKKIFLWELKPQKIHYCSSITKEAYFHFFWENAGELRFIALERKVVPLQLPSHIRGPNMRDRFKR